ncbi:hypothetical protein AA0111_g10055 [Alternaria arborescens]|nr:hypothetical protein AA0111_g10055 [Alternaria arborescens]RYO20544.1 hypothetical protein AA0111_g10055 [Alternaria arborescens]
MIAELAARLRHLADGISTNCNEDPREESRNALRKAVTELDQGVVKSHSHDDSYVLVLVDAHSYPFNGDIFYRSTDQSYPALDRDKPFNIKKRLHEPIRKHLIDASSSATPHKSTKEHSFKVSSSATLGTSRIVVRVYANTTKLENDLLRPLKQFAVQLSSMDSDFDFLGVGNEAMVELKVVDAFQAARKGPDCKHVFVAAWKRPGYISMLQTHSENVTLIQGHGMGAGAKFIPLTCAVISIPEVFNKPLEQDLFLSLTSHSTEKHIITAIVSDKVSCKDGHCGRSHTKTNPDDMGEKIVLRPSTNILHQPGSLPRVHEAIAGRIPVNAKGQRLDYYTQMPSTSDWQDYMWRIGKDVKPCRSFHLANGCSFGDNCCYGHSYISPQVVEAFQYTVKRIPCSRGSHCPVIDCIYGHICQEANCITDGLTSCSMRKFHGVDLVFASWKQGRYLSEFATGGSFQLPETHVEEASTESFLF